MRGRDALAIRPQQRRVLQPAFRVPGASWWQRIGYSGNGANDVVFLATAL